MFDFDLEYLNKLCDFSRYMTNLNSTFFEEDFLFFIKENSLTDEQKKSLRIFLTKEYISISSKEEWLKIARHFDLPKGQDYSYLYNIEKRLQKKYKILLESLDQINIFDFSQEECKELGSILQTALYQALYNLDLRKEENFEIFISKFFYLKTQQKTSLITKMKRSLKDLDTKLLNEFLDQILVSETNKVKESIIEILPKERLAFLLDLGSKVAKSKLERNLND